MTNVASTRICEQCHESFAPHSNFQRRCDVCCTYTCDWCGKIFVSRRTRKIRFCSLACTNAWQETPQARDAGRIRTIEKRGSGKVVYCITCGKPFYAPGYRLKRGTPKYCCHAHRNYPADMNGINRVLRFPTRKGLNSLELAGHAILEKLGLPYAEQQIVGGKFVVDALIPDCRIIVQWDGDFWHGNPAVYSTLSPIQAVNARRDKQCDAYVKACGYTVLRFWESAVHPDPDLVLARLRAALANSDRT